MSIGLIGHGRFGKLIEQYIPNIKIWDKNRDLCVHNLSEVVSQDYIILAVPMRELEEICKLIKISVCNKTIIDVCSLKCFSHKIISKILPGINHVGTHPLFGPQSAKNKIIGQKIVITTPMNDSVFIVSSFCQQLGLKVIYSTPEEHDKQMALSQALVHFIGRAAEKMGITNDTRISMSTQSYEDMMDIIRLVQGSSPELFEDMQNLNPFAADMRSNFLDCANELNRKLTEFI